MSYDYDALVAGIAESRRLAREASIPTDTEDANVDENVDANVDANENADAQRKLELVRHLTMSVDQFETLSGHCPMTPLLWMQYALDASDLLRSVSDEDDNQNDDDDDDDDDDSCAACAESVRTRLQLLELGLHEFPGSAILRLHCVDLRQVLVRLLIIRQQRKRKRKRKRQTPQQQSPADDSAVDAAIQDYKTALDQAIEVLGDGTHRNESKLVVELFRQRCDIEGGSLGRSYNNKNNNKTAIAETISDIFLKRAAIPMNDGVNAGLGEEYALFCKTHLETPLDPATLAGIENNRRWESKDYGWLGIYEDDIDVALANESGVSNRNGIERLEEARREAEAEAEVDAEVDADADTNGDACRAILETWNRVLNQDSDGCWMGLGGSHVAQAYVRYARACLRFQKRDTQTRANGRDDENAEEDEEEEKAKAKAKHETALGEKFQSMASSVYERGIAECPTVESLWLSYLRHLTETIETQEEKLRDATNTEATAAEAAYKVSRSSWQGHPAYLSWIAQQDTVARLRLQRATMLGKAASVVDRAIRNCPYSTKLVTTKLALVLCRVNARMLVLDTDDLMTNLLVKQTLGNGFVEPASDKTDPGAALKLFRSLLDVVRKRILFLLADLARTKVTTVTGPKNNNNNKKQPKTIVILRYDDPESIRPVLSPPHIEVGVAADQEIHQELEDLCKDLEDLYDEVDTYLRTQKYSNQSAVGEARALLARDRARTESWLVAPLLHAIRRKPEDELDEDEFDRIDIERVLGKERLAQVARYYDKAVKMVQPPHPSTYLSYIRAVSGVATSVVSVLVYFPTDVLTNLRQLRFLYQRALRAVGKPRDKGGPWVSDPAAPPNDDLDHYETALRCLCREYMLFEQEFGSARSYDECAASVQKKLGEAATHQTKRKRRDGDEIGETELDGESSSDQHAFPPNKKQKEGADELYRGAENPSILPDLDGATGRKTELTTETATETATATATATTTKSTHPKHKVKVGKLEYPAHPFTVKVSFLSPTTEDMDLVDALRPRCGAIVHAKIMREKAAAHHHGRKSKSKGWGLVQFEDRESVEKALALSDVIGIQQKSVRIERSHIPAVGLVPSGMHRVNPKGEGKSTKRNLRKRNEQQQQHQQQDHHQQQQQQPQGKAPEAGSSPGESVTATQTKDSSAEKPKPTAKAKQTGSGGGSVLAFRPRGVATSRTSRKAKINLSVKPKPTTKEGGDS